MYTCPLTAGPVLMKLYTVAVYDMRICMKDWHEIIPIGTISREIIFSAGRCVSV